MKATLGTWQDGSAQASIDLQQLLETRMLVQANSGGGKSWAVRRLLEQTAGHVQQLVIDPEGEFATLREKHDFVIAAPHDGDAVAHPRTAKLLAERLLETGVSAVLDIYDLKAHERQAFVRVFLEAIVNAPKALWRPALIVLDEAHVFCPEAGKAESAGAVIDLATRGRKRGFCLVAATQRLAKLHKDCAAELLNKLVGRTGLDVDVKRAADELGMTAREGMEKLRPLSPGEWFAFGPAISPTVRRLQIGDVKTTHPKPGSRQLRAPPKPTAAILEVLPKLADLPKEAEAEARTVEDLKRELAQVRRDLTLARKASPAVDPAEIGRQRDAGYRQGRLMVLTEVRELAHEAHRTLSAVVAKMRAIDDELAGSVPPAVTTHPPARQLKPATRAAIAEVATAALAKLQSTDAGLPRGEAAVLQACIQYPDGLRREQLTVLTGYKRSSRDTYIQRLRERGYLTTDGDRVLSTARLLTAFGVAVPIWSEITSCAHVPRAATALTNCEA